MLPQLICLPPAGAGPSLYQPWIRQYRDRLDIYPATLPGREARLLDPLPDTLEDLAGELVEQLAPRLSQSYALFGYSMGAALAYEICRTFAKRGIRAPEVLFLLGSNPPDQLLDREAPIHKLESAAFKHELREIGGTPTEILENTEAMSLFEPILRNDFRLCETYEHRPDPEKITCPVLSMPLSRIRAHLVSAQSAAGWRNFVSGAFTLHNLKGAHMLDRQTFAASTPPLRKPGASKSNRSTMYGQFLGLCFAWLCRYRVSRRKHHRLRQSRRPALPRSSGMVARRWWTIHFRQRGVCRGCCEIHIELSSRFGNVTPFNYLDNRWIVNMQTG